MDGDQSVRVFGFDSFERHGGPLDGLPSEPKRRRGLGEVERSRPDMAYPQIVMRYRPVIGAGGNVPGEWRQIARDSSASEHLDTKSAVDSPSAL